MWFQQLLQYFNTYLVLENDIMAALLKRERNSQKSDWAKQQNKHRMNIKISLDLSSKQSGPASSFLTRSPVTLGSPGTGSVHRCRMQVR